MRTSLHPPPLDLVGAIISCASFTVRRAYAVCAQVTLFVSLSLVAFEPGRKVVMDWLHQLMASNDTSTLLQPAGWVVWSIIALIAIDICALLTVLCYQLAKMFLEPTELVRRISAVNLAPAWDLKLKRASVIVVATLVGALVVVLPELQTAKFQRIAPIATNSRTKSPPPELQHYAETHATSDIGDAFIPAERRKIGK